MDILRLRAVDLKATLKKLQVVECEEHKMEYPGSKKQFKLPNGDDPIQVVLMEEISTSWHGGEKFNPDSLFIYSFGEPWGYDVLGTNEYPYDTDHPVAVKKLWTLCREMDAINTRPAGDEYIVFNVSL